MEIWNKASQLDFGEYIIRIFFAEYKKIFL